MRDIQNTIIGQLSKITLVRRSAQFVEEHAWNRRIEKRLTRLGYRRVKVPKDGARDATGLSRDTFTGSVYVFERLKSRGVSGADSGNTVLAALVSRSGSGSAQVRFTGLELGADTIVDTDGDGNYCVSSVDEVSGLAARAAYAFTANAGIVAYDGSDSKAVRLSERRALREVVRVLSAER